MVYGCIVLFVVHWKMNWFTSYNYRFNDLWWFATGCYPRILPELSSRISLCRHLFPKWPPQIQTINKWTINIKRLIYSTSYKQIILQFHLYDELTLKMAGEVWRHSFETSELSDSLQYIYTNGQVSLWCQSPMRYIEIFSINKVL